MQAAVTRLDAHRSADHPWRAFALQGAAIGIKVRRKRGQFNTLFFEITELLRALTGAKACGQRCTGTATGLVTRGDS